MGPRLIWATKAPNAVVFGETTRVSIVTSAGEFVKKKIGENYLYSPTGGETGKVLTIPVYPS